MSPTVEGPDAVASELHPTRFEVGWPPPPGAGDIQVEGRPRDLSLNPDTLILSPVAVNGSRPRIEPEAKAQAHCML